MSFNELQFIKDEIARAHDRIDGLIHQSDRQVAGAEVEQETSQLIGDRISTVNDLVDSAISALPNDANLTSRKLALLQIKSDYLKTVTFGQLDEQALNDAINKIVGEPNTSNTV